MRFLTTLGMFVIAAVLLWPGKASAAPFEGPDGSYRATCKNIKQRGDILRARCRDASNNWINSELDLDRCFGDIANINGQLQCNVQGMDVQGGYAPRGSYVATCQNIRVDRTRLWAQCQTRDGRWADTGMDDYRRCRGEIQNIDGQLRCTGDDRGYGDHGNGDRDRDNGGDNRGGPRGSYAQTCRDIRVEGDRLRARCQTMDGDWRDSSLDDVSRCYGDVVNDDGQLECTRRSGWSAPRGAYVQTCRDIYLNGDSMRARCQRADGRWSWTRLDDWDRCRDIENIDGQLRCVR